MTKVRCTIYKVERGYLLNIKVGGNPEESYTYSELERMTMLAKIHDALGPEPENSVGMPPQPGGDA